MRQEGWPPDWPPDEGCYLVGANLEPLVIGRAYLCRGAHTRADDGKRLWATFCCDGGSGQFASLVDGVTDDRPSPGSIGAKGACKACSPVTGIDVNGNVQPIVLPPRIKVTLSPQPVDLVPPACVDIQSAPCFAYWPPTPFYFTQTPVTFFVDRVGNGSSTPYSYPFRLELNAANISTCTTVGTYTIRHKAIGCSDTTGSIVANPYILFDGAFACLPCCSPCNPDATQGCTPYPNGGPPWGTGYRLGNGLVFNGIATTTGPSLSLPPPNCDNYPSVYGACPNTEQVRILSFNPLHVQMLAGYYCMFDIQGVPCATV
jgi:hypothetical protein